jgi:hypothetical protein
MGRWRHKEWKDNKGPKGVWKQFTRRVIWFQGADDIRLNFSDTEGATNFIYIDAVVAQQDFDAFKAGTLSVADIFRRKSGNNPPAT